MATEVLVLIQAEEDTLIFTHEICGGRAPWKENRGNWEFKCQRCHREWAVSTQATSELFWATVNDGKERTVECLTYDIQLTIRRKQID